MFGIGFSELLLVLAVALIVLGPEKLPELAKTLGKSLGDLKRATDDIKDSLITETGLKDTAQSIKRSLKIDTGMTTNELRGMLSDIEKGTLAKKVTRPTPQDQPDLTAQLQKEEGPSAPEEAASAPEEAASAPEEAASAPEAADSAPEQEPPVSPRVAKKPAPATPTPKPPQGFSDDDSD